MQRQTFIGVDVGTGSARAGVFDHEGTQLASASEAILMWRPQADYCEQSAADIWCAVVKSVRAAVAKSGIDVVQTAGIGFDATCSMVIEGANGKPLPASPKGDPDHNVIVWMDHRATREAEEITATGHSVLDSTGGVISPEMQTPKLLWLSRFNSETYQAASQFFDLPDWLTYRATGLNTRSLCSVVCKWTYRGQSGLSGEGWDKSYFDQIGLGDLSDNNFAKLGSTIAAPGTAIACLSKQAAEELGLPESVVVGASLIDAHAGALATLEVNAQAKSVNRLALIAGTSACHIALSESATMVPGIWGPYFGAVLPDFWATEAGQSMAGAALDVVLNRHAAHTQWGENPHKAVANHINKMAGDHAPAYLTRDRHSLADFHGNRAPLADPTRKAVDIGLDSNVGLDDLAINYLSVLQSLAYGSRHIIEDMQAKGICVDSIVVSGGLVENQLYLQTHADAVGCPVIIPQCKEPVLLGAAILGACAANLKPDLRSTASAMCGLAKVLQPNSEIKKYHDAKYAVFQRLIQDFAAYRSIMSDQI